jgi:hypothetical protein
MRIAKRIARTCRSVLHITNVDTVFSGARQIEAEAVIVAIRPFMRGYPANPLQRRGQSTTRLSRCDP